MSLYSRIRNLFRSTPRPQATRVEPPALRSTDSVLHDAIRSFLRNDASAFSFRSTEAIARGLRVDVATVRAALQSGVSGVRRNRKERETWTLA